MKTTTTLGPRKLKQLEKEIDASYSKYMSFIQVDIFDLSKVSKHVMNAVVNEGKTIEQGYEEAKALYRKN